MIYPIEGSLSGRELVVLKYATHAWFYIMSIGWAEVLCNFSLSYVSYTLSKFHFCLVSVLPHSPATFHWTCPISLYAEGIAYK